MGNVIDLKEIILEFNVYSDMFGEGMSCDVALIDADGLIERAPIVGSERLEIRFNLPTREKRKDIRLVFEVNKIVKRDRIDSRLDQYLLHGISGEQINNIVNSVDKVYYDMPISDMVTKIYNEGLKVSNAKKKLSVADTDRNFFFVGSGFNPMSAIRYLSKEAASEDRNYSAYIWFENLQGWVFARIADLMQQTPKETFYHAVANISQHTEDRFITESAEEEVFPYQKIINVEFVNDFDLLESSDHGFYNNAVTYIDPIRKIIRTESFFYDDDYKSLPHLGNGKYNPDNSVFSRNNGSHHTNYIATEWDDEMRYNQLTYIKRGRQTDRRIDNDRRRHTFAHYHTPTFASLNNIVMNITVPGNPDIVTGDVINVLIESGSFTDDNRQKYNLLFGEGNRQAKFLVTSSRHIYNKNERNYSTILRCAKDTYGQTPKEKML